MQGLFISLPVYALESTKIITGTKKLIEDAGGAMLALEAAIIVVLEIVTLIKWQTAEEPQLKTKYAKKAGEILIIGGIIVSITGVIPIILGYYL